MIKKETIINYFRNNNIIPTIRNNLHYLFFFSLFFIQFYTFKDYGFPNDEEISRNNGLISFNYLLDIFNLEFIQQYPGQPKFENYYDKDYGVVFELFLVVIEKLFSISTLDKVFYTRHLFVAIFFLIASIYFYLTLRKFFSKDISLLGTLIFVFHPRIFAQSFYNSKDIIFLVFFCISNFYFINFFLKQNIKNIFLLSLSIALTISVRPMGMILPVLFIFFFVMTNLDKFKIRNFSFIFLFCFLTFCFTYLFWPYLWDNPLNFFNSLKTMSKFRWIGEVFFNGEYYIAKYMPWFYIPTTILITTPLFILILFFIGFFIISKKLIYNLINLENEKENIWNGNLELFLFYSLLIILVTIFLIIELSATVYTGWRQIYYIYPSIVFISVYGYKKILEKLKIKKLINISLVLAIFVNIIWIIKNHPYQYAYYNSIILNKNLRNYELDYYGVSNLDILKKIISVNKNNLSSIYTFSVNPYYLSLNLLNEEDKKKISFTDNINEANYIVSNHYYQNHYFRDKELFDEIHPIKIENYLIENYELIHEIKVDNVSINSIYKNK